MKDQNNKATVDSSEPVKRGRGRPVTGQSMTNAERQRRYRQRLKEKTPDPKTPDQSDLQRNMNNLLAVNRQLSREILELRRANDELKSLLSKQTEHQLKIVPPNEN